MKTKSDPPGTGWFAINGVQTGVRQLAQQIKGLEILRREARGRTVLDLGCAEGLVSQWLCDAGAAYADGIDCSETRVAVGNGLTSDRVRLRVGDLNELSSLPILQPTYDVVLLLSVVQKLKRPEWVLDFAIRRCQRWLAIRTPSWLIEDARSNHRRVSIVDHMRRGGFTLIQESDDSVWLGVFERCT